jgi:uncharacterized protein with HEPN domain
MNRDEAYLKNILREITSIPCLIRGYSKEKFLKSEKTQKAICMTLLNIGELTKCVSNNIKSTYNDIPWKEITGMRDMAAHKYQSLNMERIWTTVKIDIPKLKKQIILILNNEFNNNRED